MENDDYKCCCDDVCEKCGPERKRQDNRGLVALVFFLIIIVLSVVLSK